MDYIIVTGYSILQLAESVRAKIGEQYKPHGSAFYTENGEYCQPMVKEEPTKPADGVEGR